MKLNEKEFNELREEISNIFEGELNKYFKFTRSTYDWSSKHNFIIHITVTSSSMKFRELSPDDKLRLMTDMLNKVKNFINSEEKNFTFVGVSSRGNFGFVFTFQPTSERVKSLLRRRG